MSDFLERFKRILNSMASILSGWEWTCDDDPFCSTFRSGPQDNSPLEAPLENLNEKLGAFQSILEGGGTAADQVEPLQNVIYATEELIQEIADCIWKCRGNACKSLADRSEDPEDPEDPEENTANQVEAQKTRLIDILNEYKTTLEK